MADKTAMRERAEVSVARAEDEIARKRPWVERFGANTAATIRSCRCCAWPATEDSADSRSNSRLFCC